MSSETLKVLEDVCADAEEVPDLDLDFHIQFPTPGYDDAGDGAGATLGGSEGSNGTGNTSQGTGVEKIWPIPGYQDKDKDSPDDEKEIVVILLGWAGSKHKNLSKYSDIYLQRGCIVLRYITPVKNLFVQTGKLPSLSVRLLRLIQDLQLESHPIVFHVFSNGGSFTYASILRELFKMQEKLTLDLRGTIFDSAPTPRDLSKCFDAVSNIFEHLGMVRYLIAFLAVLMIVTQVFWMHFKSAIEICLHGEQISSLDPVRYRCEEIPMKNWLGRLCKTKNHNYLFLYSDTDDLIPWNQVEEIADIASRHGNYVEKKKFLGSQHVQHYRKYPKEYVEAVTNFIRHSMKTKQTATVLWDGV